MNIYLTKNLNKLIQMSYMEILHLLSILLVHILCLCTLKDGYMYSCGGVVSTLVHVHV